MGAEFAVEDVAADDAVVWVVGGFECGAVGHDELGVGRGETFGASEEGGDEPIEGDDAAFDEDEVDTDEVAVAQRVFVEREGAVVDGADVLRVGVFHFGDLAGDVADGGEGVGEEVSGAVEVLEDKLVEVLRFGGGVALGVAHQGLGALGKGEGREEKGE